MKNVYFRIVRHRAACRAPSARATGRRRAPPRACRSGRGGCRQRGGRRHVSARVSRPPRGATGGSHRLGSCRGEVQAGERGRVARGVVPAPCAVSPERASRGGRCGVGVCRALLRARLAPPLNATSRRQSPPIASNRHLLGLNAARARTSASNVSEGALATTASGSCCARPPPLCGE